MKKLSVMMVAGLLVFALTGCGPGAEQILKDSMNVSKDKIETVNFELEQTTKLPRAPIEDGKVAAQNFVQKATGEYDLRTGDFEVKTTLLGGAEVGMLQVGDKQYWRLAGNWYEVPQAVQVTPPVTQALSVSQYLKEFKSLDKKGDTDIEGEGVYHVVGVPDMEQLVKHPGITDLLKDPTGKQIRTIDELEDMKVVFQFYIRKKDKFFKRSETTIEARVPNDLIQLGYAEPGDMMVQEATVTFSQFNKKLNLKAPEKAEPLPAVPEEM